MSKNVKYQDVIDNNPGMVVVLVHRIVSIDHRIKSPDKDDILIYTPEDWKASTSYPIGSGADFDSVLGLSGHEVLSNPNS